MAETLKITITNDLNREIKTIQVFRKKGSPKRHTYRGFAVHNGVRVSVEVTLDAFVRDPDFFYPEPPKD